MRLAGQPFLQAFLLGMLSCAPVHAQLYKWVDELGVTHYSDRKPDDPKFEGKARPVHAPVSVYVEDPAVLEAVELARIRARRPPAPVVEPESRLAIAPAAVQPPPAEPCPYAGCGGYYYPDAPAGRYLRRRPVPLAQAELPPGAIAGTVNSPGIIPGNTGTTGNLLPRQAPQSPRHGGKPPRFVQYEPERR